MRLHLHLTVLSLLVAYIAHSQNPLEELPEWKDPSVFEKGQIPPRVFHIPYSDSTNAENGDAAQCPNYLSLNGAWEFCWSENPGKAPKDFYLPSYRARNWEEIEVPSNWQMKGFGHPKFRNIALSFPGEPPHVPDDYNPTGCYRKSFKLPAAWNDREVLLRFDGVKSAFYLWINGMEVGYNEGGFEPSEFNITPFLKKGKNLVALKVLRFSTGSYLENQDMWRLSGIFRDVQLAAMPRVYIQDFFYHTGLDSEYRNATLHLELSVTNSSQKTLNGYSVGIQLMDHKGEKIISDPGSLEQLQLQPGNPNRFKIEIPVSDPDKWSAEFPNLYQLLIILMDSEGNTVEICESSIGFREVEMINNVFYVNGVPVKLNGVNSHMHHPDHGQAVPEETLRKDLMIMKQFNINCVRTCHYPPSPVYLELADELGIYVIDEVGDEAHSNTQLSYDSTFTEMYMDRARKLVHRDRNHPSVIMWSAGNEAGSGFNIGEVIATGKEIDPSRPAWMYGGNTFFIPYEDIVGPRYWTPFQLKNLAEGRILEKDDLRPSFMDEYLAATGNGMGGTDEYWEEIWQSPRLIGGAIWDWISPGITTPQRILIDQSPHKNHGAIMGRPVLTEGKQGRGLKLSGHDDWVEFYRDPSLDITGKQLSISFYIHPEHISQPNTFLAKGNHQYGIRMSSPDTLEFYLQENNVNIVYQTPYYEPSARRISLKTVVSDSWYEGWHHLAATYDGERMKLYIDTVLMVSREHNAPVAHTPFPLCIGRNATIHDQGEYSGQLSSFCIDNLQLLDTALTATELFFGVDPGRTLLTLDFEEEYQSEDFYAVGLGGRTYGVVWPDRQIQPELHQLKKVAQPIEVDMIDPVKKLFLVKNRHHFRDISDYTLHWQITEDGFPRDSGKQKVSLEAGMKKEMVIPYPSLKSPGELMLTVSFRLDHSTVWAKAGHEVAWNQFLLQESMRSVMSSGDGKIEVNEQDNEIEINGSSFTYVFSKEKGEIQEVTFNGRTILKGGPAFNVWRAPLANDIDPWGSYIFSGGKKTEGLGRSIDNQLRTLGMRDLEVQCDSVSWYKGGNYIRVIFHKHYLSSNLRGAFDCTESYRIGGDGVIRIEYDMIPESVMPVMLPKIGWQFRVTKEYMNIEWLGRGSQETYPDRKSAAKIGRFYSDVHSEYVPYIIPQDYGNHTDTRELKLLNQSGNGLLIVPEETCNFSFHKYSTDNLSRAMYTYQLKEAEAWTLNLDPMVSGVGGTAIRQLEKYRVKPAIINFRFVIKPIINDQSKRIN